MRHKVAEDKPVEPKWFSIYVDGVCLGCIPGKDGDTERKRLLGLAGVTVKEATTCEIEKFLKIF